MCACVCVCLYMYTLAPLVCVGVYTCTHSLRSCVSLRAHTRFARVCVCRMSISARIASRINPVRSIVLDPASRFTTRFSSMSYTQLGALVFVPSVVAFVAAAFASGTFSGWRFLAHVGPYHVPDLVRAEIWRKSLAALSNDDLLDSEVSQLLTDIEVVTQRRCAVSEIVDRHGFEVFYPLMLLFPKSGETNNFEANLRILMDVVLATKASDRRATPECIRALLAAKTSSDRRFDEYKLLLLLKLLQNESVLNVVKSGELRGEIVTCLDAQDATHTPYPALPLMPILYQFKTEKLGYETFDLVRKIRRLLNVPTNDEQSIFRKSLKLDYKIDFVNFEKLMYLTLCYSSIRVLPMISEYSFSVLKLAGAVMAKSLVGCAVLETIYRFEEHGIQSTAYYTNSSWANSIAMVSAHSAMLMVILRKFPFCFAPFIVSKMVRDCFSDGYRFT